MEEEHAHFDRLPPESRSFQEVFLLQRSVSTARRNPGQGPAYKPYLFLLPMVIFAVGFIYYPFVKTILDSFSVVNFKGEITGFAGLENYRYMISRREFAIAVQNTLKLMLINVPVTVVLTCCFAWFTARPRILNSISETLFSISMAVSMSTVTLIFKVMLNPTVGIVNYLLGIDCGWYTDRHTAMSGILLLTIWMGIGFNYLLFLSAFRSIPADILHSATLDGAGQLHQHDSGHDDVRTCTDSYAGRAQPLHNNAHLSDVHLRLSLFQLFACGLRQHLYVCPYAGLYCSHTGC